MLFHREEGLKNAPGSRVEASFYHHAKKRNSLELTRL
ncbi:hypothetical protein QO002_002615 [Pararhizobium capsulatum DSM 1112]|uniref:Uncharacterized protein n=1 Tax=Pararhizobium capsulatum DSM 1112 TaxID=1121113 RepID=A0ABU0BR98_9HYPH|nr:hypothetical protein [Pararhizobium capsulatum DSM 1112]